MGDSSPAVHGLSLMGQGVLTAANAASCTLDPVECIQQTHVSGNE